MSDVYDYTRKLVRGRIVETIFEEMFKSVGRYTVLPTGYENMIPELAQYQDQMIVPAVVDAVRNTPDFLILNEDKTQAYWVEVKLHSQFDKSEVLKCAQELHKRWNPCWLFVATLEGFYFDSCNTVIDQGGDMGELDWITRDVQTEFLSIMREYLSPAAR